MNIKEYISSGVVESYVLGLLPAQERFEFEQNCLAYPELREARLAFELALEKQAMENSIIPPDDLKHRIASTIFDENKTATVIPIQAATTGKFNWARWVAAASIILLIGSIGWIMNLKNENEKLKTVLSKTQEDLNASQQQVAQMTDDAKKMGEGMKMVGLPGTANSPQSFATVYWDTTSKDVYLLINNLPKPASDEQYQLWALLTPNGQLQTIDLGFIEMTQKPLQMYRMKNARDAKAFAITLEKKDGNPDPNLQKIYVMSNL
ncbi:MAG TPA: anti-sigma factor [Chitinophagaceae bacterium]